MEEFKGSSGEWVFAKWDGEEWPEKRWSIHNSRTKSAIAISPRFFTEGEESEANAKLFTASKELLKNLIRCVESMTLADEIEFSDEIFEAQKAIDKALK